MIIAVDGPAASGKGTIAVALGYHFELPHLDTGLLYRAVGCAMLDHLDAEDFVERAIQATHEIQPDALDPEVLGQPDIALAAAKVARIPQVRETLLQFQRDFASRPGGAILDGRDIGTKICPEADVKLFITAESAVRAARRTSQLQARGLDVSESDILAQIIARDESDRSNPAGSFYRSADAHLLDSSNLDIETALRAAIAIVEEVTAGKVG